MVMAMMVMMAMADLAWTRCGVRVAEWCANPSAQRVPSLPWSALVVVADLHLVCFEGGQHPNGWADGQRHAPRK